MLVCCASVPQRELAVLVNHLNQPMFCKLRDEEEIHGTFVACALTPSSIVIVADLVGESSFKNRFKSFFLQSGDCRAVMIALF